MQNGGKPPQNRPPPAQNRSGSKFSWILPGPQSVNRDKYAHVVLWVKYVLVKSSCVSKIPQQRAQNKKTLRKPVPMHFQTNRFTFKKIPPPPPLLHPIITWGEHWGVFVGLSTEWWDSWNGCSSTKSLLWSWKRRTYRGTLENESIQILDSFYIDYSNWSGQIDGRSQSMVKGRLTNYLDRISQLLK